MNNELKRVIDELFDLCDVNGSIGSGGSRSTSKERDELRTEFIDYISYLSAADGTISKYEAAFISEYFDYKMTADELKRYIEKNNTYSVDFEKKVPATLKNLLTIDNHKVEANRLSASLSLAYVKVFECLGREFIVCDGNADEQELNDFNTYFNTLKSYVDKNKAFDDEVISAINVDNVHAGEIVPEIDGSGEEVESLDELLEELNGLIGLEAVKQDVTSLIHLQEIRKIRKARGLKEIPVSNHLVFYGNPGTGKTTVARLLARIYHSMGILSKGQFVEVDRSGLVAGYVGQTALKVQDVIKEAKGGVLFIDEAYSLAYSGSNNDYGAEAIDTLLKAMEDNRDDLIVIVAGYPALMTKFIDSNPGLRSRFNKYINFEDYNVDELNRIFIKMCNDAGYKATDEALEVASKVFEDKYNHRGENFANAREVRNFFEKAVMKQADRLFYVMNPSDEQLITFEVEDLSGIS